MKPILIISATQKSKLKNLPLVKSLNKISKKDYNLKVITKNKQGLPLIYNKFLNKTLVKNYDIILFVHDDVSFHKPKLLKKQLYEAIEKYDIVGLAGASKIKIQNSSLWHVMADKTCGSGCIWYISDNKLQSTLFGHFPKQCVVMDGLFLAVNLKKVLEKNWKFNENYKFHHYDIASCLDAFNKNLKLGTWPIKATHLSSGLLSFENKEWKESNNKFLQEYGGEYEINNVCD